MIFKKKNYNLQFFNSLPDFTSWVLSPLLSHAQFYSTFHCSFLLYIFLNSSSLGLSMHFLCLSFSSPFEPSSADLTLSSPIRLFKDHHRKPRDPVPPISPFHPRSASSNSPSLKLSLSRSKSKTTTVNQKHQSRRLKSWNRIE